MARQGKRILFSIDSASFVIMKKQPFKESYHCYHCQLWGIYSFADTSLHLPGSPHLIFEMPIGKGIQAFIIYA